MKRTIIPLLTGLLIIHAASGQSCKYLPADCPVNGVEDYGTSDDSISRMHNPVVPQEITMENQLRQWTGAVLNRIAANNNWQVYQLSEEYSSGFSTPEGVIIAYPYRPPHWYTVSWEIIVNADSLRAWRAWLENFGQQRLDALNQNAASQTTAYDRSKPYRDSAEHYSELMGQYMQDHMAQYQKDLVAGNKTGAGAYEKAVAAYQKRSDYFSKKAADMASDPGAESSAADADALRKRQSIHFRDAALLVVEFEFNIDYAKTAGTATGYPAGAPTWFSNTDPDPISIDLFDRSRTNVLLLEGEWNKSNGGYRPAFYSNKPSVDVTTPKRIKSDRVRTVDMHLSGNPQAIRKFLAALPRTEINALIAH